VLFVSTLRLKYNNNITGQRVHGETAETPSIRLIICLSILSSSNQVAHDQFGRAAAHNIIPSAVSCSRHIIMISLSPYYYITILLSNTCIMIIMMCRRVVYTTITTSNLRRDYRGCNMTNVRCRRNVRTAIL